MTRIRPILSLSSMSAILWLVGCAEQPAGYIYTPSEGQIVDLALLTAEGIGVLYDQADQAGHFLEAASLTNDYSSILPEGWYASLDTSGGTPHIVYIRNYLDQQFNIMSFDWTPQPGAVRTPSVIAYKFIEIRSYYNQITYQAYGDVTEQRELSLEYANHRSDPLNADGWYSVSRNTPFEYEIEISGQGGQNQKVTQTYYEDVTWLIRLENFSLDPDDQRARLVIDGTFPQRDEEGRRQEPHVSGVITIDGKGYGGGTVNLYGEPVFTLEFRGRRGNGFRYNFTLASDK